MCGIVGFIGKPNKKLLASLLDSIGHRGRDDRAIYRSRNVHMGMNRLAIVDLRRGLYPIKYKHYTLLYNGEIYNHEYLRKELKKKHISPPDGCDAFVILPLYDIYGAAAFARLEGMFAISIYDAKKKEVILARDKSGEKPLYYAKIKNGFAYASEIRAVLPVASAKSVHIPTLEQYLAKGYVYGDQTLVSGVRKVRASECVVYQQGSHVVVQEQYWTPTVRETAFTRDPIEQLRTLVESAVRSRMLSDVPVGCFVSGGIDSTLIAHFASQMVPSLRTYSISFPQFPRNDESVFARFAAGRLKTNHTEVLCTPDSVRPIFENLGTLLDEPVSDPAIIPTLLLSKEARKSVTVVLTGEGADELFAGYPRYMHQLAVEYVKKRSWIKNPLLLAARMVAPSRFKQLTQPLEARYVAQRLWSKEGRMRLAGVFGAVDSQIYFSSHEHSDPLLRMQLSDWRGYLSEQLFMKADKSTMAYNLESRAPYVDTNIINFAFSLPVEHKIRWLQGKYLLKKIASSYFPWWFVWRPKHGFSVPLREWFRSDLKEYAYMSVDLVQKYAPNIDATYYKSIVGDHVSARADHADKIWSMLVLASWLKHHDMRI
jgi:asparagine synthase (glutamine-hydrolysing)